MIWKKGPEFDKRIIMDQKQQDMLSIMLKIGQIEIVNSDYSTYHGIIASFYSTMILSMIRYFDISFFQIAICYFS